MASEDRLKTLIRNVSRLRMEQSSGTKLQIAELKNPPPVYSHWMALVLITNPGLKVLFGTHFKTATAQALAASVYKKAAQEIKRAQAIDFMREYCNLVAGGIKASMHTKAIEMAISLPVITRGFDQIVLRSLTEKTATSDIWVLENAELNVTCTAVIDVFHDFDFSGLDTEDQASVAGAGVEFL